MNRSIIAVDIDDVLSRTAEEILAYSNERWGHNHTLEDFKEHIGEMWQIGHDEAEGRWLEFINSGTMERYSVIPGAKTVLEKLKGRYELIALTSRRTMLLDMTTEWVNSNYPSIFSAVHSAKIYGEGKADAHTLTKGEMLRELGADYMIDDQPKHCRGASEVGVQAVLYGDYPWNRDVDLPDDVVRCTDWPAVLEYFDKQ